MLRLKHELENINAINSWRAEAIKHAITKEQVERIDERVFYLRLEAAQ